MVSARVETASSLFTPTFIYRDCTQMYTIKKGVFMERTRKTDWLLAQGYRLSRLPFKITWYTIDKVSGKEREFISRTDDYNLGLYRSKGYVLDRKFLDPHWHRINAIDVTGSLTKISNTKIHLQY